MTKSQFGLLYRHIFTQLCPFSKITTHTRCNEQYIIIIKKISSTFNKFKFISYIFVLSVDYSVMKLQTIVIIFNVRNMRFFDDTEYRIYNDQWLRQGVCVCGGGGGAGWHGTLPPGLSGHA